MEEVVAGWPSKIVPCSVGLLLIVFFWLRDDYRPAPGLMVNGYTVLDEADDVMLDQTDVISLIIINLLKMMEHLRQRPKRRR